MRTLTVQDVVDFALMHRKNKVFRGMSPEAIGATVARSIDDGGFGWTTDAAGRLLGIVVATPSKIEKRLHVSHILTIERGVIAKLLESYRKFYDGWTITAHRHDRPVVYRTGELVNRLEK